MIKLLLQNLFNENMSSRSFLPFSLYEGEERISSDRVERRKLLKGVDISSETHPDTVVDISIVFDSYEKIIGLSLLAEEVPPLEHLYEFLRDVEVALIVVVRNEEILSLFLVDVVDVIPLHSVERGVEPKYVLNVLIKKGILPVTDR